MSRKHWALLLLLSCNKPSEVKPAPMVHLEPLIVRALHLDASFTPHETELILETSVWIMQETRGKFQVQLIQDLDPTRAVWLPNKNHWTVVRISPDAEIVAKWDASHEATVWGICDYEYQAIYLIPERIKSDKNFVHTAEHEIMHSIGMQHTADEAGVMYRWVNELSPTAWRKSDRDNFCKAVNCKPEEIWR